MQLRVYNSIICCTSLKYHLILLNILLVPGVFWKFLRLQSMLSRIYDVLIGVWGINGSFLPSRPITIFLQTTLSKLSREDIKFHERV